MKRALRRMIRLTVAAEELPTQQEPALAVLIEEESNGRSDSKEKT